MVKTHYLHKFLEENSNVFTSIGFFAIVFALTLTIPETTDKNLNLLITFIQSASLALLVLCLLTIINKLKKTTAKINLVFATLMIFLFIGLGGYLVIKYIEIIIGLGLIVALILGAIHLNKVVDAIKHFFGRNFKKWKEDAFYLVLFLLITIPNIYLIIMGTWSEQFTRDINMIDNFFIVAFPIAFCGYGLTIIGLIWDWISKKIKKF